MNKTAESVNKPRRGGARDGSGRPPKPPEERKVVASLRLTPLAAEYLRQNRLAVQEELERAASVQTLTRHEKTA
jgi:hypothetical protein